MGGDRRSRHSSDVRLVAAAVAVVGLVVTLAISVARPTPGLGVVTMDDIHEGQLEVAAAIVLIFISAVLLGRLRRYSSRRNLLLLAAVLVLAFDHLLSALLTAGFDSLSASRFATWSTAFDGIIGAMLLVAAAWLPDRPMPERRRPTLLLLAVCVLLLALAIGSTWLLRDHLPAAFDDLPTVPDDVRPVREHPALLAVETFTAACFATAGAIFSRTAATEDDQLTRWLGLGSIVMALAYVNYALFPSQFTELLYIGDMFFLVAVGVLLYGAVREIGDAEAIHVRRAVYAERKRVARDLHDGVAQELAYLSSQTQAMMRRPDDGARDLGRIMDGIERALDESRDAISVLNGPLDEPFAEALEEAAADIAQRGGARLKLNLDPHVVVTPDVRVALIRVTREAVANAIRHGRARSVSVELWEADGPQLRITDDGEGFDPAVPTLKRAYGLRSMRERVENLGGQIDISSAPGQGATIRIGLP